ncbi:hypothetical protein DFH28DRAFT_1109646 [Melampsora americana]|nr:hypothetical protein DFH28DRAFT_1109646 [Melampsora americana]
MSSQSSQPRMRSKLLLALKMSEKPHKDLEISSLDLTSSRTHDMAHNPQTLDASDPVFARCTDTSSSYKYEGQRSTKVHNRVPTLPMSPNFSQKTSDTSAGALGRSNTDQNSGTQAVSLRSKAHEQAPQIPGVKQTLECDPLLAAIARYTHTPTPSRYMQQRSDDRIVLVARIARYNDTTTSYKYADQRSARASIRASSPSHEDENPHQRRIITPEHVNRLEVYVSDPSEDESVSSDSPSENHQKSVQRSNSSGLSNEFPSHLLQIDTDLFRCSPSTPIRAQTEQQITSPRTMVSNGSTLRVSPCISTISSNASSNCATRLNTPSTTSRIRRLSGRLSSPSPLWAASESRKVKQKPVTSNLVLQLRPIDESLVESLPSPSSSSINRRGPGRDVLASLDFMAQICARRTPESSLDIERSETPELNGSLLLSYK